MTARGDELVAKLRAAIEGLRELERDAPADVDAILRALVDDLRSWKRECIAPLGTLPAPTERITDPRRTK